MQQHSTPNTNRQLVSLAGQCSVPAQADPWPVHRRIPGTRGFALTSPAANRCSLFLFVDTIKELGEISVLALCTVCLAAMHRIFQNFIDLLAAAEDLQDFSQAMADTATALDLSSFAYLALQQAGKGKPRIISTYPSRWVAHYLKNNYQLPIPSSEKFFEAPSPSMGINLNSKFTSIAQHRLFEEAAKCRRRA